MFQAILFVLILLIFRAVAGVARRLIRRGLERSTLGISRMRASSAPSTLIVSTALPPSLTTPVESKVLTCGPEVRR